MANQSLDSVCNALLQYFYNLYDKGKSIDNLPVGIRQIRQDVDQDNKEITKALEYLVQLQLVKKVCEIRINKANVHQLVNSKYKISDLGIIRFEKPENFLPDNKFVLGINIDKVDSMTVIGEKNNIIIDNKFKDIGVIIEDLVNLIQTNQEKLDCQQVEIIALLRSIESLLISGSPDKSLLQKILATLFEKVKDTAIEATVTSLIDTLSNI
jgi:hypothetical protein